MRPPLNVISQSLGTPEADLLAAEALLDHAAQGQATLQFYTWDRPVLVMGYGQDATGVDAGACRQRGVRVLRRVSGGTGVLHHRDLALVLGLPSDHPWVTSIPALYDHLLAGVMAGLRELGVVVSKGGHDAASSGPRSPICFEGHVGESLLVGGRKAVGCSQVRRAKGSLVEAHLLLHDDPDLTAACFGVGRDRVRAAMTPLPACAPAALARALTTSIAAALGREPREAGPVHPPEALARRYHEERWAPVR